MAIIQSTGFYRAMVAGFVKLDTTNSNNTIKIYKNLAAMPADADDWTSAGSAADELVTFNDWSIISQAGSNNDDPIWGKATFTTGTGLPNPATRNATATGTAAWYAMYNTADEATVILGEISLAGTPTGTLILDNLSLVLGNPITVQNWAVSFTI